MKVQNYFNAKVTSYREIKGHFNQNFKVQTANGTFHLKIFKNKAYAIRKWIRGEVIKKWDGTVIKKVCAALAKLHNLDKAWQIMDYQTTQIVDPHYQKLVKKYQVAKLVPCHNDLNKDNIIVSKTKAHFIDFEFQRLNNKHWDVANIINEDKLGRLETNLFLKHYNGLDPEVLDDFLYINKVFNDYWKNRHWKPQSPK